MSKAAITLFAFLCFLAAANAAKDYKNETISCAFGNYFICYSQIASLGANFTVKYAESLKDVTEVCKNAAAAKGCIESVPVKCNTKSLAAANANVTKLITSLCTNMSRSQSLFLNSSACYNKNIKVRQNCVKKYSKSSKEDAKTLCCRNLDIQKCLKKEMNVCPKNSTDFQNEVIDAYTSPHNALCANYTSLCNSASVHVASAIILLLAIKVTFMNSVP